MNSKTSLIIGEKELSLRMDGRTVAEHECEIRHLRRRLERLEERTAIRSAEAEDPAENRSLAA